MTKEELDAIIAEAKAVAKVEHEAMIAKLNATLQHTVDTAATAKAEHEAKISKLNATLQHAVDTAATARTEHEAEIAKLNATLLHTVDTVATDTGSRNLQLVRENEVEQSKNFLDRLSAQPLQSRRCHIQDHFCVPGNSPWG